MKVSTGKRNRIAPEYFTTAKSVYEEFCRENPKEVVSFADFKKISHTSNSIYAHYILEGEKVKLPQGFGSLAISKKKQVHKFTVGGVEKISLAVNWVESKKKGKKVYHANLHTNGYRFKWLWFKHEAFLNLTYIWQFNATRVNSRKVAQLLKQENSPYIDRYREWGANSFL